MDSFGWHCIRFRPFPLRLIYYLLPYVFVVSFLDPSSHKMCWSVSSHWSSCYGFKYDVGYPYLFYFHHGNNWVHNFSFVLFFFLPLKLTETLFISLSSHLDEVKTMEHSPSDHFPSFLRNAIVIIIIKNAVLSLFICLSSSLSLSSTQIFRLYTRAQSKESAPLVPVALLQLIFFFVALSFLHG